MDLVKLFEIMKTGGPIAVAAVFCWMWWMERRDRKAADEQLFDLSTASVEAITKNEIALNRNETALNKAELAINTMTKMIGRRD